MPNPLLPRLTVDNQVTTFGRAGDWEKRDPAELERVSEGLDITKTKLTSAAIDSIPSMWARPLLFEMALYNDRHPVHTRILGEWRGLLAMLALKEWCDFPLTTEQLDITNVNPIDAKDFLEALHKLRPKGTLDPATTWETLNVILFNDKPIGITSPTTLVCTAVSCSGRILRVPWFIGKFLENPVPKLNNFEKEAVVFWLKHLRAQTLNLTNSTNRKRKADLNGLLNSFIDDLGNAPPMLTLSNTNLGLAQDLFKCLDKPVEPRKDLPSSVKLVPSRSKQPETSLLVLDQHIPEVWGVEPQNVIVWKGKTLATMQNLSGIPKLTLPAHFHQRSQHDFFTKQLFVINQETAFHEHSTLVADGSEELNFNGVSVTPILPITEELLTYLDAQDLNDRITFDQQNDSIDVRLRLTLSGINEQDRDFTISKKYSLEDVKQVSTGPVLAIWPNFRTPDWKAYYTYYATAGQDAFYAKPFLAEGETSDPRTLSDNRGNVEREITKTEHFPEAMLCEYGGDKAGILLISVPEKIRNSDGANWTVGVDFGTSSTTIYRHRDGDANPQSVTFNDRLLRITNPPYLQPSMFYNDLLSPEPEKTPFFSLFQKLENNSTDQPLLDGHIYFLYDYKELSNANEKNIVSDLKWSTSTIDREYIRIFLKQLCLQCTAEAINDDVKEVNWKFSHPLAFSASDKGAFENIWKDVRSACETATGVSQRVMLPAESESVVSAKFFASTLQNPLAAGGFASGAVCIDIGGETSDVSIWQDNELYWQTSLRFAGRHIFLDVLKGNPEFLKIFGVDSADINLLKSTVSNNTFYAQADALIQGKGKQWLKELAVVGSEPTIQPFFQLISVGVSGLLYYVGLLLNYLSQNIDGFNSEIPSIYIGGNGSKILHWMAKGNFNPDDTIAQLCRKHLKSVICKASGFHRDNNRGFEISKYPKEEAAYGLVAGGANLKANETKFDVLAGESFTEAGIGCEWTETLTDERLSNRLSISKNQLEQIDNFIESFNTGLGAEMDMPVDLNETLSSDTEGSATVRQVIFENLENVFQDYSDMDPNNISVEPLFILALKALLEVKTRRWKNTGS